MKKLMVIPSLVLIGTLGLSSPAFATEDEVVSDDAVAFTTTSEEEGEAVMYGEPEGDDVMGEPREGVEYESVEGVDAVEVTSDGGEVEVTGVSAEVESVKGLGPEVLFPLGILVGGAAVGAILYARKPKALSVPSKDAKEKDSE
jgi:hypothetical protein